MHELSITENILTITLDKANEAEASKVSKVHLVIGEMSGIVGECVEFYFSIISRETIASEAVLSIRNVPTRLKCKRCETEYSPAEQDWACPACRQQDFEMVSGRDLFIESIEVE